MALFAEAGSDRSALFLDDSSLISNRLGRPDVADELLDCSRQCMRIVEGYCDLRELMAMVTWTPEDSES